MGARWIEVLTVADLLDRAAEQTDRDAVVFPTERASYPELAARATDFARGLHGLGVRAGDKVGILMHNCLDFVVALVGTSRLGAVVVPVNGRFKSHELGHVIGHADLCALITASGPPGATDYPALLHEVFPGLARQDPRALELPEAPALRTIIGLDREVPGLLPREELEAAGRPVAEHDVYELQARVKVRDIAMLMYTSGTTARPKGCLLTHEALVRHAGNVARSRFFLTAEDRYWDPLPLFHIGGIVPMLSCFYVTATFVHAGHFDPDVALRQLEEERCTVAYPAFETLWLQVLNHPRFAQADLSALRLIQNIATPERLIYLQSRLQTAIEVSSYGATECSSNLTLPLPDDPYEVRMHTLGHPLPGIEIKVVDPDSGAERGPREVGELCFRGYSRFEGYYKEPELTASVIDSEGWFHSGDLGYLDEAGRFVYAGRLKDMLKVGGENVSALEVEDFIASHEAVDIVQVVGAPDARYGEVPAAFVQLKPGARLEEDDLIEFCRGRIATYKVPRYVRFVHEWPMSGTKVQKFVLREWIARELEERGITEAPRIESRVPNRSTRAGSTRAPEQGREYVGAAGLNNQTAAGLNNQTIGSSVGGMIGDAVVKRASLRAVEERHGSDA
jgi:fatty-acyl-CoA synthase